MLDSKLHQVLETNGVAILNYFERRASHEDAPDLLAEVMFIAWRRIRVVPDEPHHARMWLFGVARNVLKDHDRSQRRRLRLTERVREVAESLNVHATSADHNAEVTDAVRRLPPPLRELVILVHWDGFTLTEVATHLGVRASTVRGRYQRARQQLRAALLVEPVVSDARPERERKVQAHNAGSPH